MARRPSQGRVRRGRSNLPLGIAAAILVAIMPLAPAVAAVGRPGPAEATAPTPSAAISAATKLRSDLAALVAGDASLDPRVPPLVPGHRPGDLPYFAVLSEPNDAAHVAALTGLGARLLRTYRSIDAVALVSDPTTVLRVAALPWVTRLAPIELVVALDHVVDHEPDQSRATTGDLGAPTAWNAGITGRGVRIAILDTGHDPVHPDLDDLDFRRWSQLLPGPAKLVDARDFNGSACRSAVGDGHGHGTHVAGIATGTGDGAPGDADDGRVLGVAPDAELAVGKVLTDAGAGLNSDLIAALEWAAMPAGTGPITCPAIGADVVNLSLGSESRPDRLNSGADVDLVSLVANRLAVRHGTTIVAALGNSGPYIGSALETPGSASQVISVSAAAKDHDVNHDDTMSGDTCAGWRHPPSGRPADNDCRNGPGDQPSSISSFSSRGPSGDVWLRPDVAAPGYNIVAAQASQGVALAANDLNRGTRDDPLYATATGTSMAAPATAGTVALLLDAYAARHGSDPAGGSGLSGFTAPAYALVRAALMNTAQAELFESRWILTLGLSGIPTCPQLVDDLTFGLCDILPIIDDFFGSSTAYEVRNGPADPYVGPLAEGAGRINVGRSIAALRDGVVIYSAASGSGDDRGTGPRDLQGSWQVGSVSASSTVRQKFVLHAAPGAGPASVAFTFIPGRPSDGSRAIPTAGTGAWTVSLPSTTAIPRGGDAVVEFRLDVPAGASAGIHTGAIVATVSGVPGPDGTAGAGQVLRIPVFAAVALHDPDPSRGEPSAASARVDSERDVYAKGDTTWPSAAGQPGTGSGADWLVKPVELAANLSEVRFTAWNTTTRAETYDLYLYDASFGLIAATHPFAAPGVTDRSANDARGPTTSEEPATLVLLTPAGGRHYLVVSRAKVGRALPTTAGDMGSFALRLDEIRELRPPAPTNLAYEGDSVFRQGSAGRLAARLTDADGGPVAGRTVSFTFDDGAAPCPGGACVATTDYRGLAQLATEPVGLAPGVHEVHVRFAGDPFWLPSGDDVPVLVLGAGGPGDPGPGGGKVTAGGWFVPDGSVAGKGNDGRVHFAFHATAELIGPPSGEFQWRDVANGVELRLEAYQALSVDGSRATILGTARDGAGATSRFELVVEDRGEPGRGSDTIRLRLLDRPYERTGVLGGGNIQVHAGG